MRWEALEICQLKVLSKGVYASYKSVPWVSMAFSNSICCIEVEEERRSDAVACAKSRRTRQAAEVRGRLFSSAGQS